TAAEADDGVLGVVAVPGNGGVERDDARFPGNITQGLLHGRVYPWGSFEDQGAGHGVEPEAIRVAVGGAEVGHVGGAGAVVDPVDVDRGAVGGRADVHHAEVPRRQAVGERKELALRDAVGAGRDVAQGHGRGGKRVGGRRRGPGEVVWRRRAV